MELFSYDECRYCGAEIHSHDNWDVWLDDEGVDWCPIGKDTGTDTDTDAWNASADWHVGPNEHAPQDDAEL